METLNNQNFNSVSKMNKESKKYLLLLLLIVSNLSADESKANCFSKLFFTWIKPLLKEGQQKPLEFEDLPHLRYLKCFIIVENKTVLVS